MQPKIAGLSECYPAQTGKSANDVCCAESILAMPEVAVLLKRCQRGLEAVFARYACNPGGPAPYERGYWTAQDMKHFANELDISAELSLASLQQLFHDCIQHEV